jgi:hypothetical protein
VLVTERCEVVAELGQSRRRIPVADRFEGLLDALAAAQPKAQPPSILMANGACR